MKDSIPKLLQIESIEDMLCGAFIIGSVGGVIMAIAGYFSPVEGLAFVGFLILLVALMRLIS